jgi:hypothetical protein
LLDHIPVQDMRCASERDAIFSEQVHYHTAFPRVKQAD